MARRSRLWRLLGLKTTELNSAPTKRRGSIDHVIILDGTMSTLRYGHESNAGQTFRILRAARALGGTSLHYEAGVQWTGWRDALNVIEGRGINRQIRRCYGVLASRYRPGDRIFLFGYSRGAYGVRSLAGLIDRVGLLRREEATEGNIRTAYRLYENGAKSSAQAFARTKCHANVRIEMIGAWDTVKALGLRAPIVWRFTETKHQFHNHQLGHSVRHGYHALAANENRMAYAPVLWRSDPDWPGEDLQQMWFRGTHGDIGGQLGGFHRARPLANIPLVWMLENAENLGLTLPPNWRSSFPCDPRAPSIGGWHGIAKLFWSRKKRVIGADPSEARHPSLDLR